MPKRHLIALNRTLQPPPGLGRPELSQLLDDFARHGVAADIVRAVDRDKRPRAFELDSGPRASTDRRIDADRPEPGPRVTAEDVLVLRMPAWARASVQRL